MYKLENSKVTILRNGTNVRKSVPIYRVSLTTFEEVIDLINSYITDLIYADPSKNLSTALNRAKDFFKRKTKRQKEGIVAEMISHIFVRTELHMEQLSLLVNTEDNSLKKGFDGVYQFQAEAWLGESKSSSTNGTLHKENVGESYRCLSDKVDGTESNNPWNNAISHYSRIRNGISPSQSIKKQIDELSDDFDNHKYTDLNEFNIIPISTLFVKDTQTMTQIENDLKSLLSGYVFKEMIVLCINNSFLDLIIKYMET